MCGHVGLAGNLEFKDEATLKRLLLYDFFRGPDSTGIASFRDNGDVKIAKVASHPLDLFDMQRFKDTLSGFHSKVLLGHNRAATKGLVNNLNAHPYHYDHIVGAHNGTLDMGSWKELEEALGEKFDVDSQAIIAAIAKLGIEETVPMLKGAWALVWIDTAENTLNFLRNKERSFWYAYTSDFKKMFWASEWPFIYAAVAQSAQPYELYIEGEEKYKFFATQENWWYKWDLAKLAAGSNTRPKARVKELKGKEAAPAASYACGVDPFPRRGRHTPTSTTKSTISGASMGGTTGVIPFASSKKETKPLTVHMKTDKERPLGPYVTRERFEEIAKYGCSYCGSDVEYKEPGIVLFLDQGSVMCSSCSGEGDTSRVYTSTFALSA